MPPSRITVAIAISNLEFGGAQQQIVELLNNLDTAEFDVHLVSLSDFIPLAENLRIDPGNIHVIRKRWKYDVLVPFRLASLLRRINADIVHGFLFDAEIACRVGGAMAGTAVVAGSERNCDYVIKKNQMAFYNLTKSLQTCCVANSHAGAQFNANMLGYPLDHYHVVHNGVNIERFCPGGDDGVRAEHGIGADELLVGVFGSFKKQKNHELLFRVASTLLPEFERLRFLLVGDELYGGMHGSREYKDWLEGLIDELGIRDRCVFVGNRNDVERYYRACDFTVLPSRHEGMPNVVLESMASGVPVIATRVADNALLVPDKEVGLLVESENVEQMTEALRILLTDDELRQRFGQESRRWVEENFSAAAMSRKMGAAYQAMSA